MRSILLRAEPPSQEALVTALWQHGTLGIIEECDGLRAFFDDDAKWRTVLSAFAERTIEIRTEIPPDPSDFAKQDWDPIPIGARFWVAPSWIDQPTPPDRLRLTFDSPNAFGTGRHETTQLAIEALEELVTPAATVLDIGCGSGILSQAALMLGAREVFSCDIQSDAVATSKPQLQSRLFMGSADSIRAQSGDIIIANISAKVVDALSWDLNRVAKPEAVLILTGFIREKPPERFTPERVTERGDWLCWLCRPQPALDSGNRLNPLSHSLQWW